MCKPTQRWEVDDEYVAPRRSVVNDPFTRATESMETRRVLKEGLAPRGTREGPYAPAKHG